VRTKTTIAKTTIPTRRTQIERSAETRRRLVDASIQCIVERGYAGTTTTEIARRAGLSRGAQLNHFATKDELIAAALEHFYTERAREFRDKLAGVAAGPERLEHAITLLWEFVSDKAYVAWLELEVAARTDAALRKRVRALEQKFRAIVDDAWREVFPGDENDPVYRVAPLFTWALFDGLSLQRTFGCRSANDIDDVLVAFKRVARMFADNLNPE
jgi:AcrR family transcriptional regulator